MGGVNSADVLVMGGGIAGVSAAARLAGDMRVILLEREAHPGTQATGRSAAMFIAGYGNTTIRALSAGSWPCFETPDPETWDQPLVTPRGELLLARQDECHLLASPPEGCVPVTVEEACALVPILDPSSVAGALHDAGAMDIDVDHLLQGWLRALRRAGGRMETGAEVLDLARRGGAWRVRTTCGEFEAPVVVNAAGAWADEIAVRAGLGRLGLQPYRRSAAILPAPAGLEVGRWPMFGSIAEDWYARPMGGRLMVSPADEDPVAPQDAYADDLVLAEGLARYEAMVVHPVTRVERSWAGLRSFLPDRTPAAGFDPGADGFFWLAGQGGYGIQTAPAMADLTADLVAARTPRLDAVAVRALDPARLRHA